MVMINGVPGSDNNNGGQVNKSKAQEQAPKDIQVFGIDSKLDENNDYIISAAEQKAGLMLALTET